MARRFWIVHDQYSGGCDDIWMVSDQGMRHSILELAHCYKDGQVP